MAHQGLGLAGAVHRRDAQLELRYLAAASVGPVEGRAPWIGAFETRMLRVEMRDRGRDDRLIATALVRVDAALPR